MITDVTRSAIAALLAADKTATKAERDVVLAALDGRQAERLTAFPSILPAADVAKLTSLSTRSLRSYARRGYLRPAYFAGSSRAWGYHADSVREFILRSAKESA